jgi:hypothetical protein
MTLLSTVASACRAVAVAIGARPRLFFAVTVGVAGLSIMLPPLLLSAVRAPWTYFTFNPWLKNLPAYVTSDRLLGEKLDFVSRVALFWFSADGSRGAPEWGFAVDSVDLLRMVVTGLLVSTYFCLLLYLRDSGRPPVRGLCHNRAGGTLGALAGVVGLSTGPCSVIGCGAPVLPVVGLAFAGLSSGTLALLSGISRVMAVVITTALVMGVAYLGWRASSREGHLRAP